MLQHEDDPSPLQNLETAAVHCASAIRLSPRESRLHFLLGLVLEEQHYATEIYGLQRKGGGSAPREEENHSSVHRALMKYLDAWSLSPDSWEYNLHVGRLLLLQGRGRGALQHLQSGLALRPLHPALRFFTGLALLQQEPRASEDTEKEAALFLQQGLEHFVSQRCSKSWKEQDPPETLSGLNTEFLRGLLTLGELQQRNTRSGMSAEQVYHTAAVLAAQSVSLCVCGGRVGGQLEWVLLDAHFALLQRLDQQGGGQAMVVKRCRALTDLIGLSSIPPCQELLDLQEKTCRLAAVTSPRDGHALCLLGLAQLAQYDNSPDSEKSQEVLAEACLSFQASIELEDQTQGGPPPEQLTQQTWWQDRQNSENEKSAKASTARPKGVKGPSHPGGAKRGARRGRGGPSPVRVTAAVTKAPAPIRGGKAGRPVARGRAGAAAKPGGSAHASKAKLNKSKQACCPGTVETAEVPEAPVGDGDAASCPVNCRSHVPRLGLARALSRSADTREEAQQLYQEVISMAPGLHEAYMELVQLLEPSDPRAAAELYCRFPLRPVAQQSLHDAFITGEIVRLLLALDQYQHPQLGPSLVAHAKVMGLSSIEKYMDVLDAKCRTELLRSVYAKIHDRQEDDQELQEFFRFRCWI
ncbi:unnamed protein product [Pleuronectes platessa]|uniref:Uncharacterized protein n=1 Tax=Pleuronectes platessa TaxID=8262 RepID=A0A9N7UBX0_PLEPL|nr:unnamed protein product [Pleuronectes platessa]